MTLWAEFLNHRGRRIHKWSHYFPVYERHFAPFVNRATTIIEIGVGEGGSLQLWKRYLGPFARIVGIDIRAECRAMAEDQIAIRIGSQSDPGFLQSVLDEFGTPDIVLDDGSHKMTDILASFEFLYPRLPINGVYMVEDLHTAYWDAFGGGLGRAGSFIERSKALIDELNADHAKGAVPITEFTRTTMSMHFYDSIVVFERGRHLAKQALFSGHPDRTP